MKHIPEIHGFTGRSCEDYDRWIVHSLITSPSYCWHLQKIRTGCFRVNGLQYPVLGYVTRFPIFFSTMEKSIYTSQQKRLQELLHQLRQQAGLRQIDLAKRLGVPQSFVSKYESGERRLDILELRAVCASLGISLQKFARRLENALSEIPDQES